MATSPASSGEQGERLTIAPIVGPDDPRRFTDSGLEVRHEYGPEDVEGGLEERLGRAGEYPYTRGIHPDMYRGRKWTMRQYAGYATAEESNARYRFLSNRGRAASPSPLTCPRRSVTTPTTRWRSVKWARSA